MSNLPPLTDEEKATYQWQIWSPGFGEAGQEKLKAASVMISRVGGLGSVVAYELAAAGVGKLVLAHAGNIKASDLNRQLLMTHQALGTPRLESANRRLKDLNPRLEIEGIEQNISEDNAAAIVQKADIVIDCAPLFEERYAMNRQAVLQGKPLIECAMYDCEAYITTVIPGQSACLACLYPQKPPTWKRQFPVFGAVSGTVGCMGAMEAIKIIADLGQTLAGFMVAIDLRYMTFRKFKTHRDPNCAICGNI